LEIRYFDSLASTQIYLIEAIKNKVLHAPIAVIAETQEAGVGSRENTWIGGEGNFFVSIALSLDSLPKDLPLGSASIYFSYIMKEVLNALEMNVWLKWPNDFYQANQKVGGTITQKIGNVLVCGIGVNLSSSPQDYASLAGKVSPRKLLDTYLSALEKTPTWKQVFSRFEIEFCLSKNFSTHNKQNKISLKDAELCPDGSLLIDGKKVYSLR
jgi:BirA family biotin operon repressor/biotin-[acetyl-CoA-carboxylase] ligase